MDTINYNLKTRKMLQCMEWEVYYYSEEDVKEGEENVIMSIRKKPWDEAYVVVFLRSLFLLFTFSRNLRFD